RDRRCSDHDARRAGLRDLAHAPLERGQPADDQHVPVAGGLEKRDGLQRGQGPGRSAASVSEPFAMSLLFALHDPTTCVGKSIAMYVAPIVVSPSGTLNTK